MKEEEGQGQRQEEEEERRWKKKRRRGKKKKKKKEGEKREEEEKEEKEEEERRWRRKKEKKKKRKKKKKKDIPLSHFPPPLQTGNLQNTEMSPPCLEEPTPHCQSAPGLTQQGSAVSWRKIRPLSSCSLCSSPAPNPPQPLPFTDLTDFLRPWQGLPKPQPGMDFLLLSGYDLALNKNLEVVKLWGAWTQLCFPTNTICLVTSYLFWADWQVTSASRWPWCCKLTPFPSVIYLAFISSNLPPNIQEKKRDFCRLGGQNKSLEPGCLKCCTEKLSVSTAMALCSPSPAHFYFPARQTRNKPAKNGLQQAIIPPKTKAAHNCHIPALQLFIGLFFQSCLRSAQFLVSIHIPTGIPASFLTISSFFSAFSVPWGSHSICATESQEHNRAQRIYFSNKLGFNFKTPRKVEVLLPASSIHHKLAGWDEP